MSGLVVDLKNELEMIVKWLKDSGLQINGAKTEVCLFHHSDQPFVLIEIMNQQIRSKKSMNILGVVLDSKMNWHQQVSNAIKKGNKSLYAIKMIKSYFNPTEIKILLDYFFTLLFYITTLKSG